METDTAKPLLLYGIDTIRPFPTCLLSNLAAFQPRCFLTSLLITDSTTLTMDLNQTKRFYEEGGDE